MLAERAIHHPANRKKVVSGKGYRKTAYYTLIETQQRPTFATPHIKINGAPCGTPFSFRRTNEDVLMCESIQ